MDEELDLKPEVEEDGSLLIDLRDNLGKKTDLRGMKRERELGFKRFLELRSDDETADFISLYPDDQIHITRRTKTCFNSVTYTKVRCGTLE